MYVRSETVGCHDCSRNNNSSNNDRRIGIEIGTNNINASTIGSTGEAPPPTSNSTALVSLLGPSFGYENHYRPHVSSLIRSGLVDIYHPASSSYQEPSSDDESSVGSNMHLLSVLLQPSSTDIIFCSDHLVAILDEALDILPDLPTDNDDRDIHGHSAIALPPLFKQHQ